MTCPNAIVCACASVVEGAVVPSHESVIIANIFVCIYLHAPGGLATPKVLMCITICLDIPTCVGDAVETGWWTTEDTVNKVVAAPSGKSVRRLERIFG